MVICNYNDIYDYNKYIQLEVYFEMIKLCCQIECEFFYFIYIYIYIYILKESTE